MASTDVVPAGAVVKGTDLVVTPMGATPEILAYAITNGMQLWVDSGEEGTEEDFLLRTLTGDADDEAAILGGQGLTKLDDILDVPVRITGYQGLRNSEEKFRQNSRFGVYAIVEVTDRDGTLYTVAVGPADAVAKVVRLAHAGHIPTKGWSTFTKSKEATKAGYYPINLVAADDPTTF